MKKPQPIEAITALCNPFKQTCWLDIDTPIERQEVMDAAYGLGTEDSPRGKHIQRIMWFYVHGWKDAIQIDVGVPKLGANPVWIVTDGNHRLAAAILRKQTTIDAEISGDVKHARSLGLNP